VFAAVSSPDRQRRRRGYRARLSAALRPLAPRVQKAMEGMLAGITDTLTKSIDAVVKQFAEAHTRSNKNKVKAIFGEDGDGDPKKTFGQFLLAVMSKDSKTLDEMGSKFCDWDQKTAMATQTGTSGGFLVPTEFLAKLLALVTENSICRSLATVIPMSARSVQIPASTSPRRRPPATPPSSAASSLAMKRRTAEDSRDEESPRTPISRTADAKQLIAID
jgi:HK97 family phage major capsid protein